MCSSNSIFGENNWWWMIAKSAKGQTWYGFSRSYFL